MPFASTAHRLLAGAVATVALLGLVAGAVVWNAGGAVATPPGAVIATAGVTTEPPASSTTSSTTTSTSTTTTTKPLPTTAPVRTTVARRIPATTPPTTAPAPPPTTPATRPPSPSAEQRCADARQWVSAHGLDLPAGWGFRCPAPALENGTPRWGVACWNCTGDGSSWIAVDVDRIGSSDATLRYVIAHETCHANDYGILGISTEIGADLCAALHGAPRP